MNLGRSVTLDLDYEQAVAATREALAAEGFGVLTEIDVAATMKAKLDVDLAPHLILGACNPPLAHRALSVLPDVSLLLPCNVTVRVEDDGRTVVTALDPQVMVAVTGLPALQEVADDAAARLGRALAALAALAGTRA